MCECKKLIFFLLNMWFHIRIEEEKERTGDLGTQNLLRRKRHQYLLNLLFF
jgi:hypothetical protein